MLKLSKFLINSKFLFCLRFLSTFNAEYGRTISIPFTMQTDNALRFTLIFSLSFLSIIRQLFGYAKLYIKISESNQNISKPFILLIIERLDIFNGSTAIISANHKNTSVKDLNTEITPRTAVVSTLEFSTHIARKYSVSLCRYSHRWRK